MKYIDAEKLLSEIEGLKERYGSIIPKSITAQNYQEGRLLGYEDALYEIKKSLQQEQPEVDLEKELIQWHERHFKKTGTYEKHSGFYLTNSSQLDLVRHFDELGQRTKYQQDREEFAKLKAKEWQSGYDEGYANRLNAGNQPFLPSNLDEAAENIISGICPISINGEYSIRKQLFDLCIAVAEWMAEQGATMEITDDTEWADLDSFVHKNVTGGSIIQIRKK